MKSISLRLRAVLGVMPILSLSVDLTMIKSIVTLTRMLPTALENIEC
jgi:hypothetical protein